MRQAMLLIIVGMASLTAAQDRTTFCTFSDPLFSLSQLNAPIDVQEFKMFTTNENSGGEFTVVNHATRAITNLVVLAEFRDGNDKYLMTIPFASELKDEPAKRKEVAICFRRRNGFRSPFGPGKSSDVFGYGYQTSAHCPHKVVPTLVDITFSEGPDFHYAASEWRVETRPSKISPVALGTVTRSLPFENLVELQIDGRGHISHVSSLSEDPVIEKWFRTELSSWSFSPALRNGKPVPSALKLLFRVHKLYDLHDPTTFNVSIFQTDTVVPIDIFSKNRDGNQFLRFGGVPFVVPNSN